MVSRTTRLIAGVCAAMGLNACSVSPPASQFPNGQAALDRMKATFECARGVQGNAKIDDFGDRGRLRGDIMLFASDPARVRFDVVSPFGVLLATLTSDGQRFTFFDMKNKVFYEGPPTACNIGRLTQVQIPADPLVKLLRGEAPLLVHDPQAPTIKWDGAGFYVVTVPSTHQAVEQIHIEPIKEDFNLPWQQQRVRVLQVSVSQAGFIHYKADLLDHAPASTMPPRHDAEGIDDDIAPSGPACRLDVPRRIHVEMVNSGEDLRVRYQDIGLNPPLPEGVFTQPVPGGVRRQFVNCR
jgi:outer membrane lipoprotein-sorting protein